MTCSPSNTEANTKTAAKVVKTIRGQPGGSKLITSARKLPSGAFALTFKSAEAKKSWKNQGRLESTFGAIARAKESTLNMIVFRFPKGIISNYPLDKRLEIIISQNQSLGSSLHRVGVLKGS